MGENSRYIQRLYSEWKQHSKIIIGVNYDSTISYWPSISNNEDIERCINLLQVAYATGAHIVVFTTSSEDRFEEIQKHCEEKRIPISGINKTPIALPYGNDGKIYANIFLDDRGGFVEAMDILETAMYKVRGDNMYKQTLGEHF